MKRSLYPSLALVLPLLGAIIGCGAGETPGTSPTPGSSPTASPAAVQVNHFPAAPYSPDYLGLLPSKVKWNKTALTYSVDRGVDSRTQEALEALLAEATARWSTATNNLVTFTRVSSGADIQVTFVSASDPDIGAGESGSTLYTFSSPVDNRSLVTSAAVKIRAELPDGQFVPLVAHEIGHALGISGHSNQSGDTMFPSVSSSVFVTARDANTLARLYLTAD